MKTISIQDDTEGNTPRQILFASMVGSTIELFDFYLYATAAVIVFPRLFFPAFNPSAASLASLATFGVAFLARPFGSVLFGHFGDRLGRKKTLLLALATMGFSTVAIGTLPTYSTIGPVAPVLLVLCRLGQGIGLGGEWGGAVLLAIENAPADKRSWYGMFPQLGAPFGFFLSGSSFLLLSYFLTDEQFFSFGWRLPFLASVVLIALGVYVRLTIRETPAFRAAVDRGNIVKIPMLAVIRYHARALLGATLSCLTTFLLFYILTVFSLSWGTSVLGYSRGQFILKELFGILFFALTIPVSAILGRREGRWLMFGGTIATAVFGLMLSPLVSCGPTGVTVMTVVGLSLMGLTYGPLGRIVSELFPTAVRYTGSSLAFSLGAIVGASPAPYITTWLARAHGLQYVGYYLSISATLTLLGLLLISVKTPETQQKHLIDGSGPASYMLDSHLKGKSISPKRGIR